jgi:hypothetical protein
MKSMKNKNIYSLGIITIFIFFIFSIQISFAQTADGACSGGATVLEKSCTFQKGVSRISGKCQVKDPRNPSLGLTCRSSIGSSCSGDTCENGLVCINEVCSRPRGTKTEGQSCSGNGNECIAGLECQDFVCKKERTITGTVGGGASNSSSTPTSSSPIITSDSAGSNSPGGSAGSESGLVKCGVSRDCTICDIFILIRDIFNFALGLLAALAVLSIVIGGVYVLTSAGNSGRLSEGYGIITNAVIGLLLVMASFLLFSFVLVSLGFQSANFSAIFDFQDGQIFSVKCDTASTFNDRGTNGGGVAVPSGPIDTGSLNVACLGDTTITGELSAVLRAISVYETPSRGGADSYTLPPNSATASGRYQIINSTWSGWSAAAGVSERTTSAYQASPASQDRAAAWWLRDNNITTCDSFAASARANVGSYRGACQWTPVPGCASCSNKRYCQENDTTRAYPDFAQLCKTLDADNCP